jgi:hypothetical protein
MANIRLRKTSVSIRSMGIVQVPQRAYINLAILKSLLQVVVDGLVGDLADKGEIRDSDFLLLCRLEGGLSDLRLPAGSPGLRGGGILLSSSSFGDGLWVAGQSIGAT